MTFYIKQNDTSPVLRANLEDASGTAINLAGSSVRFHMRFARSGVTKVDAAATIIDGENGIVDYQWIAPDTDTNGTFQGEFEVTYSDGSVETFPNDGYFLVNVPDDLA
jgi:hypothetical protein